MGKITLQAAQSLPLDKFAASSGNVRCIEAGISIADLAEDIGRRGLLLSLNVRPIRDEAGAETGRYGVVAGGRRFAALQLLVTAKRLNKTAPVPCSVQQADIAAEEDSLAENTQREPLQPLDQYRAFQALREHGLGEEEIAARFFVTPAVVRQRLRLATVSPKLLQLYADDAALTLEQPVAFSVSSDHTRQEAVWEALSRSRGPPSSGSMLSSRPAAPSTATCSARTAAATSVTSACCRGSSRRSSRSIAPVGHIEPNRDRHLSVRANAQVEGDSSRIGSR